MSFHPLSAEKTRDALRAGTIAQRDEARYWIASSLCWMFYLYHAGVFGQRWGWFLLYDVGVALAILWIGVSETLKANGGDAGTEYLRRIVLIGTPLGIWVLVGAQALGWASWFLFPRLMDAQTFADPELAWQVVTFAMFNGMQIIFWWRLHYHLRQLNRNI